MGDWLTVYLTGILPAAAAGFLAGIVKPIAAAMDWALSLNLGALGGGLIDAASALLRQLAEWSAVLEKGGFGALGADGGWSRDFFGGLSAGLDAVKAALLEKTPVKSVAGVLNAVPGALAAVPLGVWLEKAGRAKA